MGCSLLNSKITASVPEPEITAPMRQHGHSEQALPMSSFVIGLV